MKRVMKRIEVAKTAGFCFGVNRAVEMTYKLVESGKKVSTFGPLIHNPVVIEDLEKKGVRVIDSPMEALPGTTVVVRTHGVGGERIPQPRGDGRRHLRRHLPVCQENTQDSR